VLNHMICPTCGHDFYTDAAYAMCAACQTVFYASQSRTVRQNNRTSGTTYPPMGLSGNIIVTAPEDQ